jgi:negative regulator of sigma E activity
LKYCPRCNFTFADFHHVCDFDGAQLINAPEPPSNGSRPSLLRRCLKSPVLLASVGLCAVVASAFLIGYFEVVNQTNSIVKTEPAPALPANALPPAPDTQSTAMNQTATVSRGKTQRSTSSSSTRRPRTASTTVARLRLQRRSTSKRSELARRTELPQPASKKDPILTAMLKTTWRVLKKPFSF